MRVRGHPQPSLVVRVESGSVGPVVLAAGSDAASADVIRCDCCHVLTAVARESAVGVKGIVHVALGLLRLQTLF